MLAELKVQNLALIRELTLSLGPGANILTGETGAGKSILAGALGLLRGAKSSAGLVRAGAEEARVEALFLLERPEELKEVFDELGLEPAPELVIHRTVAAASGRTRIRVNGALATVSQLAALGEELLAVSGQHDQQSLTRESRQLDYLDAYGGHHELLREAQAAWRAREAAERAHRDLAAEIEEAAARRDLHEFQLQEIRRAAPRPGEDQELADLKAALKSASKLSVALGGGLEILMGGRGSEGVLDRLGSLARLLERSGGLDARLAPLAESARECSSQLSDLAGAMERVAKDLPKADEDPESLDDRLSELARLKRKYGPELEDVLAKAASIEASLSRLDQAGLEMARAAKELERAAARTGAAALALREARTRAADSLCLALASTLKVLGFPKISLKVEVAPLEGERPVGMAAGPKGADSVTLLFCPNPGEGLKPLSKIASGGELSRVMMALKIAQEPGGDQSLVFDEIDSGLSGATAEAVAAKMAELSGRQQLLVITHLPQMASLKGKHFQVFKSPSGDRTETFISELDDDGRTMELARMLDGAAPSPEALALSRRLLNL